jgi:very-short-patch-repair endonuclease
MNDTVKKARTLRHDSTEAEIKLWRHLRDRQLGGFKFRRQHPFPPYIADFFCEEKSLIVEIDGGQHTPEADKARTKALEPQGLTILRFWNNEVLQNTEGVLLTILARLKDPSPRPSPDGRGGTRKAGG